MNVLQLISSSLGYYGAERVVVTLSSALEEIGVTTVVGAFSNSDKVVHIEVLDKAKSRGLKTEQILCHGRWDRKAVLAIGDIVDRHKIDIIHCHGIKPNLYSSFTARHTNIALVSTCHLWVFDSKKDWVISALERSILNAIDRVVVVSDHMVPQVRRFGVRADVIYNGVDLEPFRSPASDLRLKMNWGGRPIIGAIARLAPQKGLHNLLRAAPEVLRDQPDALFVLVGDGPERQALETKAKSLGIRESVCFLGIREDIPELLSAMDVVAIPSLSEGLPMALLEAMASGKAVVASSVGAVPQVIQDRVNGLMMAPGDVIGLAAALKVLLEQRDLREALGQKARETIETRFSAASMAKRYSEVYRKVILNKGRTTAAEHN